MEINAQSITLLKDNQRINSMQTLPFSKEQLAKEVKSKEIMISSLEKNIIRKRIEMKKLSQLTTNLINKKLKANTHRQKVVIHPEYANQKLNMLQATKNHIYIEIESLKKEINAINFNGEISVKEEILSKRASFAKLEHQYQRLKQQMQFGKQKIKDSNIQLKILKESQCLLDLDQNQKTYLSIQSNVKSYEKHINLILAEDLIRSAYYFELKNKMEKVKEENTHSHISPIDIQNLIDQINQIAEDKKQVENQNFLKIKILKKQIQIEEKKKPLLEQQLRTIINEQLRQNLKRNRFKSQNKKPQKDYKTLPSISQANLQLKTGQNLFQKKKIQKIYMLTGDDEKTAIVGKINLTQNTIKMNNEDKVDIDHIEQITKIIFYLSNNVIIGLKSYYLTASNQFLQGKIFLTSINLAYTQEVIILDDVKEITFNTNSLNIYLYFIFKDGKIKELGRKKQKDLLDQINLQVFQIKDIEVFIQKFQQNQMFNILQGLKITLCLRPIEQKLTIAEEPIFIEKHENSNVNRSLSELKIKKRMIPKSKMSKVLNAQSVVDFRLGLHRNNLV